MARISPRDQALAVAATELTATMQRAILELSAARPEWSDTEMASVVVDAASRIVSQEAAALRSTD